MIMFHSHVIYIRMYVAAFRELHAYSTITIHNIKFVFIFISNNLVQKASLKSEIKACAACTWHRFEWRYNNNCQVGVSTRIRIVHFVFKLPPSPNIRMYMLSARSCIYYRHRSCLCGSQQSFRQLVVPFNCIVSAAAVSNRSHNSHYCYVILSIRICTCSMRPFIRTFVQIARRRIRHSQIDNYLPRLVCFSFHPDSHHSFKWTSSHWVTVAAASLGTT